MITPKWIQRELNLIDPMYFAVFNPCIQERKNMSYGRGRWQVKKWKGIFPKPVRLWDTELCEDIITICKESMTEDGLQDIGYEEIDMRTIHAIRESHWWKLEWKKNASDLDWRNERRRRQEDAQLDYESKYVAKRAWRALHEPTVCLSGKEWKV